MSKRIPTHVALILSLASSVPVLAQTAQLQSRQSATLIGTVTDVNGDTVPNARVVLKGSDVEDERAITSNENGFFEFRDLQPGVPYQLSIRAKDFADWTSSTITLDSGQFKILAGIQLRIETERTAIDVK